jgi:PP-loop superfamily ATP-utilizing enzyme
MNRIVRRCAKCVLSENFPKIKFDEKGVCNFCNDELLHSTLTEHIENARMVINGIFDGIRGQSEYDAILCYSGGKDSTYTLKLAIEKYHLKVLAFTLDNGFISSSAFSNISQVVTRLGVDHITYRPSYRFMKDLFRFSTLSDIYNPRTLTRISANCNSCITIVNITALKWAMEKGIPLILAGFTLGQIPANTIWYRNNYEFFEESRRPVLEKLINALGPDVKKYMEIPSALIKKESQIPYNVNLLTLENITEDEIIRQITPLGWVKPDGLDGCSTNCTINSFNNYVHEKRFGFNPYELELSHLIRKGLMTRKEAIEKLSEQPRSAVEHAFHELGIDPVAI